MRAVAIGVLLCGCGGDGGSGGGVWHAEDFLVPATRHLEFTPLSLPDGVTLMLRPDGNAWELREGEHLGWDEGTARGVVTVSVDDGLWLDESQILPARIELGATGDGTEVTAMQEWETWYGTFDRAVAAEVDTAPFAGEQVLAPGFGPIQFTYEGVAWDLVYYEDVAAE